MIVGDIFGLLATVLWVGFAVFFVLMLRPLLSLVRTVTPGQADQSETPAAGPASRIDLDYASDQLDRAADRQEENRHGQISRQRRAHVLERARRSEGLLRGALILWVDDQPERILAESRMLQSLGPVIALVDSNDDARHLLAEGDLDVVISSVERARGESGLALARQTGTVPLIYYVTERDFGTPAGAFGLTNQVDELLHLVLDALERSRLPTRSSATLSAEALPHPSRNGVWRSALRLLPHRHAS
jgi:hypothetical protein